MGRAGLFAADRRDGRSRADDGAHRECAARAGLFRQGYGGADWPGAARRVQAWAARAVPAYRRFAGALPLPKRAAAVSEPKTIGVIGGMGPAATLDLFGKLLAATNAERDQDHFRILI